MAKVTKAVANDKVTIKTLSEEYGVEGSDIRALLRANGLKAPEVKREPGTFGPKAKYEWDKDSADLKKIRAIIEAAGQEDEAPKANKVKAKAKAAVEAEDAEDVEETDDSEEEVEAKPAKKIKKGKK